MKNILQSNYRCTKCDKLLFRGLVLAGNVEIKCVRCGHITIIDTVIDIPDTIHGPKNYSLIFNEGSFVVKANTAAETILGYSAAEFEKLSFYDINPLIPANRYPVLWNEFITYPDKVINVDTFHYTKDGQFISVIARIQQLVRNDVPYILYVMEVQPHNTIVPASSRIYSMEQNCDIIAEIDTKGGITYIHPKNQETVGYEIKVLLEMGVGVIDIIKNSAEVIEQFSNAVSTQKTFRINDILLVRKDGTLVTIDLQFIPKYNDSSNYSGYTILGWKK
jgi:PAS domain-containing protein/phage FluMu protein Com